MRRLMTAETVSKTWLITLLIAWPVAGYLNLQFGIVNQVLLVHELARQNSMDFLQLRANVSFIGESVYRLTVIGSVIYLLARKAA